MRALSPKAEGAIAELPQQFAAVIRLVDIDERTYKDAPPHGNPTSGSD